MSTREHWDVLYASRPVSQLGWYEEVPHPSLRLLARCQLEQDDLIMDVGAGASTFIDCLLEQGFRNIVATDISETGLSRLRQRLWSADGSRVQWVVDDVTRPADLDCVSDVALWHDRALLHFLTEEAQRCAYRTTLERLVRPGGYVILAAFSTNGATECSGLPVRNYDLPSLAAFVGQRFHLIDGFEVVYHMPSGAPRPFVYACFQRTGSKGLAPWRGWRRSGSQGGGDR